MSDGAERMARRRGGDNGLDAWPGYVDALSTLLMVIIFVLLVFVLAQAFLSVALSGRDKQLDRVNRQLAEAHRHAVAGARPAARAAALDRAAQPRPAGGDRRARLAGAAACARCRRRRSEPAPIATRCGRSATGWRQQLADAGLQAAAGAARAEQLQQDLTASPTRADAAKQEPRRSPTQLADARRQAWPTRSSQLADAQARLAEMQRQIAELDKTVQADKDTIAGEAVRPRQAGRADARARPRCATSWRSRRRTRRRARHDRAAAPRRGRAAAGRGEEARRFGARADRAAQPAGGRVEGAAGLGRARRSTWRRRRARTRTCRSPTWASS